jgi:ABC-type lipoprotein release transport system permease subunit
MTLLRLLLRNLLYHWRGNSAVFLGVVVGTAVLTGALLVGDSLRGSLRQQTLDRLGWVDQALVSPRFVRQALADELVRDGAAKRVEPAILLQCTASGPHGQARGVTVLGVTPAFLPVRPAEGQPEDVVWLSGALARALDVKEGDPVTLRLQKPGHVPRESALGRKDVAVEEWDLTVGRVLGGDEPGNRFNLRPEVEAPRNAFVPLTALQRRLALVGRVNALLAEGGTPELADRLKAHLHLDDWGLVLATPRTRADALLARYGRTIAGNRVLRVGGKSKPRFPTVIADGLRRGGRDEVGRAEVEAYFREKHPYLSLESHELLIDATVAKAALAAAKEQGLRAAPTLVYLVRLSTGGKRIAGVVAALDPAQPEPLGPFLREGQKKLDRDDIVLADEAWQELGSPPNGSQIVLAYKPPVQHGPAPDQHATFRLTGAGPHPTPSRAADPGLTPEFPGITDKDTAGDWDLPFDDPKWSREAVREEYTDAYWDKYRAAPKAYINLARGEELWKSRFGEFTSIRLAPPGGTDLEAVATRFERDLIAGLDPARGGLAFDDVKRDALEASRGGGFDFSWLFLAFSFFLIAAALLLVGLLFRLNLDRRAAEVGLLFAQGYRRGIVFALLLGEGGLLALVGMLVGTGLAIAYSALLVRLLAALWPGGALQSFLRPYASWTSLVGGGAASLLVSVLTIAWVVYGLGRVPPRALLAGQTTGEGELAPTGRPRWSRWVALGALVVGLGLIAAGPFVPGHEAQAGTFFGGGALLLTACLAGAAAWMKSSRRAAVAGQGWWAVGRLGVRNAARHPARSLLTAGLLASAAFLLVAVEVFRRHARAGDGGPNAPDGGFALVAESDLPVVRDLNSPEGRREVLDKLERQLVGSGQAPAEAERRVAEARALLEDEGTQFVAFRARAGDDVSCLNLYQPRRPRLLGVPRSLIERGGFTFAATDVQSPEEKANPWALLLRGKPGDEPIPAFAENNTAVWMLDKGLRGAVEVRDARGDDATLVIAGLLKDSVFQSSVLVSEEQFLHLYPETEGYNFFQIQAPRGREAELRDLLQRALADRGFEVTPTVERLNAYLAVENTYLTTFQALGGLGLLLGSLGLAVVLLRAVWERRGELALLRALGFRRRTLGWLVLAENGYLLVLGLAAGTASALAAVAPYLIAGAGSVPWAGLAGLLAVVLAVGLAAGTLAVATTLRAPLVPALRRE